MIFDSDPNAGWLDDYMTSQGLTSYHLRPQAQTVSA
jgi:hypothetical protein